MHRRETYECTACIAVKNRGTLTHQVRNKEQTVRADRAVCRGLVHEHIGIRAHLPGCIHLGTAERVAIPLERKTCRQRAGHHRPGPRHCTAERMHASLWINLHGIRMSKHDTAGSDRRKGLALNRHTGAHSTGHIVRRTGGHRHPGLKPGNRSRCL